jgi:hypothetical protein
MRQRPAMPRASDRSIERRAAVPVSKRALLVSASVICATAALIVCLPRGWVAAGDSTGTRRSAIEVAGQSNAALSREGADPRGSKSGRAHAAELSDAAAHDAASSDEVGATQPTRVVPSVVELPADDTDKPLRSSGGIGGSTFGFDFFSHISTRPPSNPPDGRFVDHHPDGGLSVEGMYEGGARDGDWSSYYADGSLRLDGQYVDGKRVGRWKAYHPSGQLMGEGEYGGGLREGEWVLYYSNGLVKEQGLFEHDLRHGPWQFYDGFGQLEARSGLYRYGRLL